MPLRSFFTILLAVFVSQTGAVAGEETSSSSCLKIIISVAEQKLAVVRDDEVLRKYSISTSRYGLGDSYGSYRTPIGHLKVAEKIGDGLAAGTVLKRRNATGEVLQPNAPGRDPIVSRILWLAGQEPGNSNAYGRCVYIHGTPDEKHLGRPVSYGCIRMRSADVIELYAATPIGIDVSVIRGRLPGAHPLLALLARADSTPRSPVKTRL